MCKVLGVVAVQQQELLQTEIEKQLELGEEGLAEEDKWMLEVNLNDLEVSSGVREAYWLVAIEATRESNKIKCRQKRRQAGGGQSQRQEG